MQRKNTFVHVIVNVLLGKETFDFSFLCFYLSFLLLFKFFSSESNFLMASCLENIDVSSLKTFILFFCVYLF